MKALKINASQSKRYRQEGFWTEETLLDRWNRTVARYPDREYVADDRGGRYTYRQLDARADRLAAWLAWRGVRAGDVVSIQLPPCCEFAVITVACLKAGAVLAPLGMCYMDRELADLLRLVGSKVHFSPASHRGVRRDGMLAAVRGDAPGLETVVLLDGEEARTDGAVSYRRIMAESGRAPCPPPRGDSDGVAVILCTSGTTRGCKAVMLTHNNILFSEDGFNRELGLGPEDVMFMPAPLTHATGFHHGLVSPMLLGAKVVLQREFHCREAIRLMNRERCTYSMGATPFVYDVLKVLEEEGGALEHLRFYLCGGAPVPGEMVRRAWRRFGILVCEVYGSTESVPHAFVRPGEALELDGNWSGRAMPGVEIRVVDEQRRPLPPGEVGEEASRGPGVFVGYLGDPEATGLALDDEGWYYSGDLCVADERGYIRIVGRKKDIIMRGGENLNANEMDENLEGCPGVLDHAVVGMPDERLGERICAFLVPEAGRSCPGLEEVIAYLQERRVPKRHWPERVECIDAIPRTESGKVRKHLLAEEIVRRMAADPEV